MNYQEKLKDPRWQRKRLKILERDDFQCQRCCEVKNTLHVHHLKYEGSNPWDTPDEYLQTLCENCHKEETENGSISAKELVNTIRSKGFLHDDLIELAEGFNKMEMVHVSGVVACALSYLLSNPEKMRCIVEEYFERNGKFISPDKSPF